MRRFQFLALLIGTFATPVLAGSAQDPRAAIRCHHCRGPGRGSAGRSGSGDHARGRARRWPEFSIYLNGVHFPGIADVTQQLLARLGRHKMRKGRCT